LLTPHPVRIYEQQYREYNASEQQKAIQNLAESDGLKRPEESGPSGKVDAQSEENCTQNRRKNPIGAARRCVIRRHRDEITGGFQLVGNGVRLDDEVISNGRDRFVCAIHSRPLYMGKIIA
jgi:hypothetical protein